MYYFRFADSCSYDLCLYAQEVIFKSYHFSSLASHSINTKSNKTLHDNR